MKAIVASGYGGPEVLSVEEVQKPTPKKNEVLIKVHAASVNSGDVRIRSLDVGDGAKGFIAKQVIRLLLGFKKPRKVLGSVLAGTIVSIGDNVNQFNVGDEVYAMTGLSFGAY